MLALTCLVTRASYDEAAGVWRINGVKRFITNGNAEIMVVLARSEEGTVDARGLSLFWWNGMRRSISAASSTKSIHTSPNCEIQFVNTPAQLDRQRRFCLIHAMGLMNGARPCRPSLWHRRGRLS